MLQFEDLTTGYGRKAISQGLCGRLPMCGLTVLIGANGCGKSTLLRTLAGLQKALHGSIRWQGKDAGRYTPRELARTLSIVLTERPEAPALTAGEVVEMGRIPYARLLAGPTAKDRQAVSMALETTRTADFYTRSLNTLSDGEKQRIFIAKALAQDTPAILLDEPTAFLDFASKIDILRLLRDLAHGAEKAILLSTHDIEPALHYADELWLLDHQGLRSGPPKLLAETGILDAFFRPQGLRFDSRQMRFEYEPEPN